MQQSELVSVIVPVYNNELYLEECIQSILAQTYTNIELIIINDGSTDRSLEIAERFASIDCRIRIISQPNQGPSAARNLGLDNHGGGYVTFVDADDTLHPQFIELLLTLLYKTGSDIAIAGFTHNINKLNYTESCHEVYSSAIYLEKVLYQTLSDNSVWGKLYYSRIFNNVRFADMRYEDLEIYPRICMETKQIVLQNNGLYFYRVHTSSFMNSLSHRRIDALRATDLIIENIKKYNCNDKLLKAAESRKLAASFNIFLITYGKSDYAEANRQAWNNIKSLRRDCLVDRKVLLKIKLGILASYLGTRFLSVCNYTFKISS